MKRGSPSKNEVPFNKMTYLLTGHEIPVENREHLGMLIRKYKITSTKYDYLAEAADLGGLK